MVPRDRGVSGMMLRVRSVNSARAALPPCVARAVSMVVVLLVVLRPHPETGNPWIDVFACDAVLAPIVAGLWGLQVVIGALSLSAAVPIALAASLTGVLAFQGDFVGAQRVATLVYLVTALQSLLWLFTSQPRVALHSRTMLHLAFAGCFILAVAQALEIDPFGAVSSAFGQAKLKTLSSANLRVFGSYYNANWAGCAACCWLSLIWLEVISKSSGVLLWTFLGCVALTCVAMTGSRSAAISTAVLLAFTLLWFAWNHVRFVLVALCIVGLVSSFLLLFDSAWIIERIGSTRLATILEFEDQASFTERLVAWKEAIGTWKSSPYVGVGRLPEDQLPHNALLSVLCAVGAIGASAVLASLVFIVSPYVMGRASRLWWFGTTTAIAVMYCTGDFIWSTQVSLTAILLVCCGASVVPSGARGIRSLESELKIDAQADLPRDRVRCSIPS